MSKLIQIGKNMWVNPEYVLRVFSVESEVVSYPIGPTDVNVPDHVKVEMEKFSYKIYCNGKDRFEHAKEIAELINGSSNPH